MQVDFTKVITTFDGEPIAMGKDANGNDRYLTVGIAAQNALLGDYQDEKASGEEKVKRFKLAQKVHANESIATEEAALIKQLVGKAYAPLVVGQVYATIEGDGNAAN